MEYAIPLGRTKKPITTLLSVALLLLVKALWCSVGTLLLPYQACSNRLLSPPPRRNRRWSALFGDTTTGTIPAAASLFPPTVMS